MVIRLLDRQISVLLLDIWEGALAKSDKIDRVVPNREVGDKIGRLKLKISRRRWHPSGILQCKSICDLLGKVCFVLVSEQLHIATSLRKIAIALSAKITKKPKSDQFNNAPDQIFILRRLL